MRLNEMDMLVKHFDRYFEQSDSMVIHPLEDDGAHVDVLIYEPNEKFPFWKLVTMGASDYKMPKQSGTLGRRNEYIMFVDGDTLLHDRLVLDWYYKKLLMIASYARCNKAHITYAHSFEWENEDPQEEMVAAFLEFPQVVPDPGVLRCKLSPFKTVVCLQTVLLNQKELDKLMEIGPMAFSEYLYSEDGETQHFLSERHRSEKF